MPAFSKSSSNCDFILDDTLDTKVPVYSDEIFLRGIYFCAKFIGSTDVPRPQNRLEIVTAMRRIRYEYKAKGASKKKVVIRVAAEGVSVYQRTSPSVSE
ncbi:hypothetical protein Ciccas_013478 [Cichlidogyrus casuarinus]|uniref:Uncharacterized protein n=1 Tax=Cichlidogyrus casuarinus TaxID=1844966 RepID=A0ABD2PKG2_9PLAT